MVLFGGRIGAVFSKESGIANTRVLEVVRCEKLGESRSCGIVGVRRWYLLTGICGGAKSLDARPSPQSLESCS